MSGSPNFWWIAGLGITVLAVTVPALVVRARRPWWEKDPKQIAHREHSRRRREQLASNPATLKYAQLMEKGGYWTDAQIAYDKDVNASAVCVHLRPFEHGMRFAGMTPYLYSEAWEPDARPMPKIRLNCRINTAVLTIPDPVRYCEGYQPERSELDNPYAVLECAACGSSIELVHREWPRPETKWFPSAPVM